MRIFLMIMAVVLWSFFAALVVKKLKATPEYEDRVPITIVFGMGSAVLVSAFCYLMKREE
jgi:hypothetical protein